MKKTTAKNLQHISNINVATKRKKYLIVGSNNFWYSTTHLVDDEELQTFLKHLKEEIREGKFADEPCTPYELLAYELVSDDAKLYKVINS